MDVHENLILVLASYLQLKVYIEEKNSDCNDILLIDGLAECSRVVKDFAAVGGHLYVLYF